MQDFFKQQPDWLKTWQESQEALTKQFAGLSAEWVKNMSGGIKNEPEFFSGWFKSQGDLENQFKEFGKRMNETISNVWSNKIPSDMLKYVNTSFLEQFYKNWLSNIELPGGIKNPLGVDAGWQQASNFLRTFMEKENPFFASFGGNKITDQMKNVFGMFQGTLGQEESVFSNIMSGYQSYFGKLFESSSSLGTEKLAESFESWTKDMEKNLMAPKLGINRELAHDMSKAMVLSNNYINAFSKMARLVEATSRTAGIRFQTKLSELSLSNKPVNKFTDLCALWSVENEAVFLDVMGTQEFATLQGDFVDAGHRLKIQVNKLAEKALGSTPIALNRDLDLAIAEIHQMKRDMKAFQRELQEMQKEAREARKAQLAAEEDAKIANLALKTVEAAAEEEAKKAKIALKAAEAAAQEDAKKAKIAIKMAETSAKEQTKKVKETENAMSKLPKREEIISETVKDLPQDTTQTKSENI